MSGVSVIIPCYNNEPHVRAAIESVFAQDVAPEKVVVIDDGSTDASVAVIEAVAAEHSAVQLIRQENAGGSKARNAGIDRVESEYIAFLDADDLWLPGKLSRQLRVLEADPSVVSTHTRVFDFKEDIDDLQREETTRTMDEPGVLQLVEYHWVTPSSMVFRAEPCVRHGLRFRDEFRNHAEDLLFCADLTRWGSHRLVDAPLTAKRVHGGQVTTDPWHRVWSAGNKITWLGENSDLVGAQTVEELKAQLGSQVMTFLEGRYWRRELDQLPEMIEYVRGFAPQAVAASVLAGRRIWPRWVYRARDGVSKALGRSK